MTSFAQFPPRARRSIAIAEAALFVGSILVFMWLVQPATGWRLHVAYYVLMVGFAWLSARAHGETPRARGLRLDNLAAAARQVLPATVGLLAAVAAVGWAVGGPPRPGQALGMLPLYLVWALVQQYGLNAFVQRRLWDAGMDEGAAVAAAALFAIAHLPNPVLFVLTFVAGWMWAAWYRRCPNLFVLALSHALLATVVASVLPASFTGGLRVGPGYWRH